MSLSVQEHKKLLLWKLFLTLVIGSFGGTEKSSVTQVYLSIYLDHRLIVQLLL